MSEYHTQSAWKRLTRKARPIIQAQLPLPCVNRCVLGGVVMPTDTWDVAHPPGMDHALGGEADLDSLGPAHAKCNRRDGQQLQQDLARAKRTTQNRMLPW